MGTTLDDYHRRLEEIRVRIRELREEEDAQFEVWREAQYGSPEYLAAEVRQRELRAERDVLREERDKLYRESDAGSMFAVSGFHRPTGHLVTLLNKGLGALPKRMLVIEPNRDALSEVRSYRLPAFMAVLVACASLLALSTAFPWMAVSPYVLTQTLLMKWTGNVFIAGIVPQVIFLFLLLKGGVKVERWPSEGKFLDKFAMFEEQWFRSGAENWTFWQRVYSCVAFGAAHVVNFIYPLASLIVVGIVLGGATMAVYLREHGRSGDTRRATLASTKFHATYNRFAVFYIVVAVVVVGAYFIS